MSMLTRRLQVLLDDERYDRLATEAAGRKVSVATVVREAIDRRYPSRADLRRRRAAADAVLAAEPHPVPVDPAAIRAELDKAHDRAAR